MSARTSDHPLVAPHITAIAPYQPGKPVSELQRELGAAWPADGAVKLASNENPYGPSPRALAAMAAAAAEVARYPDAGSFELRDRLARHLEVGREQIIIGSGSNEIINLAVQVFCGEGEEVLTPKQQFLCYRLAAEGLGRTLRESENGPGFALSVDALLAAVTPATKVVFLANPNNPTGRHLGRDELARLVTELPPRIVLVIDEAYLEFVDAPDYASALPLLRTRERLIVLRTFSKIHGLAGLRIGYGVTHAPLVELVNRVRLPFNVTSIGQAAAAAALDDPQHVERTHRDNARERTRVADDLARRGFAVIPSQANFVLAGVPAPFTGPSLFDALLRRGVIVRPLLPYGLDAHVRVSVGTAAENDRLFAELDALEIRGR
jgi:histidinol-phosphate aminotransferase